MTHFYSAIMISGAQSRGWLNRMHLIKDVRGVILSLQFLQSRVVATKYVVDLLVPGCDIVSMILAEDIVGMYQY